LDNESQKWAPQGGTGCGTRVYQGVSDVNWVEHTEGTPSSAASWCSLFCPPGQVGRKILCRTLFRKLLPLVTDFERSLWGHRGCGDTLCQLAAIGQPFSPGASPWGVDATHGPHDSCGCRTAHSAL